jgi:hypothetical protein
VISGLAFLVAVGVAGFAGSAVLSRFLARQPEQLRIALWWLLAVIFAASCAWVNGGWPFPPSESRHWIGYVLLFAALLRSIPFVTAQLVSALVGATLGLLVTMLPMAQTTWGHLTFGSWFFAGLVSYLLVRLAVQKEFETASVRAAFLLTVPLVVSAGMLFLTGSAMLAELALAGGIAVAAAFMAQRSSALGRGFVEITLLFHFLLLLNSAIYGHLPPLLAWVQWIVPALVMLLGQQLHLLRMMTRRARDVATVAGLGAAECAVALLFYFTVRPFR